MTDHHGGPPEDNIAFLDTQTLRVHDFESSGFVGDCLLSHHERDPRPPADGLAGELALV